MYPLKFKPIVMPKVWGAEHWLLSGYGDNTSVVANGYLQGNTFDEIAEIYMDELLGQHVFDKFNGFLPLLFKKIDANDKLSVQVHPNDEQAAELESLGKSEMWYITKATHEAQIAMGFARKTSRQQVKEAIEQNTLPELINYVPVVAGDVANIPAGTIHAMCGGTQVLEIQETSDITYRLYDYARPDEKGNMRQLHVEQGLEVLNYNRLVQPLVDYEVGDEEVVRLVSDEHFTTNLLIINHPVSRDYVSIDSFVVLMAAEGAFSVGEIGEEEVECGEHELVMLPAAMTDVVIRPKTPETKILEVYVP